MIRPPQPGLRINENSKQRKRRRASPVCSWSNLPLFQLLESITKRDQNFPNKLRIRLQQGPEQIQLTNLFAMKRRLVRSKYVAYPSAFLTPYTIYIYANTPSVNFHLWNKTWCWCGYMLRNSSSWIEQAYSLSWKKDGWRRSWRWWVLLLTQRPLLLLPFRLSRCFGTKAFFFGSRRQRQHLISSCSRLRWDTGIFQDASPSLMSITRAISKMTAD